MPVEPLLEVRNLSLHRKDGARVLCELNFEVGRGEILGVVGQSGSGKSQLLLSLLGLQMRGALLSGSARFGAQELVAADESAWRGLRGRQIAMLFQDPLLSWNPYLRIGRQLVEVLQEQGMKAGDARERVIGALADVELAEPERLLQQYPHELSGGMRQRALLAMAVLGSPRLLLADEPTTALDPTTQLRVLQRLRALSAQGMSILLVTHDLGVVAAVADRVLVLEHGVIVEQGETTQLLRSPVSAYARTLLNAARELEGLSCLS
ncbi:MAG TPA: ABC transporter ATP-binding protein [Steroidobacteraceae bacterium]|nr:ABC transporter ATP-binding protein [Steroidobacteraceae bacterium]